MRKTFGALEARILGCLIEKEFTTPEYYPLTLNSLTAACNQKSNRDPVAQYDEEDVRRGVEGLRQKGVVHAVSMPGGRAVKYGHSFSDEFKLIPRETALLCELMLRGRQTLGELKGHAGRMYAFRDLAEVEATLGDLAARDEPLVARLAREAGRKEARYVHLLSGEPAEEAPAAAAPQGAQASGSRAADLEAAVSSLRTEVEALRRDFEEFKAKFE